MRVLYNKESFDPTKYGPDRVIKESTITQMQFNPKVPEYIYLNLQVQDIEDETDFIQFGQVDQTEITSLLLEEPKPSSWVDNLIENPNGKWKFGSFHLQIDRYKQVTLRQTYGFLDYCGDIGGLIDGLYYLFAFLLTPIWKFKYS